jgi:hypothetical protein
VQNVKIMSERCVVTVPMLKVHPDRIVLYSSIEEAGKTYKRTANQLINLTKNKQSKSLSSKSQRKLTDAIKYLNYSARTKNQYIYESGKKLNFKLAFITLTLPSRQIHSDTVITKQILHPFLTQLSQKFQVNKYVWRAELQLNQNIHYHILVDKFIDWQQLRTLWNNCTEKLGYVSRYRSERKSWHRNGFRLDKSLLGAWNKAAQLSAYKKGCKMGWCNPNSSDVHSLRNVHNVAKYVIKYMSKSAKCNYSSISRKSNLKLLGSPHKIQPLSGNIKSFLYSQKPSSRLWSASYNLSNLSGAVDIIDSKYSSEVDKIRKSQHCYIYDRDYYSVCCIDIAEIKNLECNLLYKLFTDYYNLLNLN